MKAVKLIRPAAVLCAAALLGTFAACRAKPPVPGPPDPSAEEYSVASRIQAALNTALEELPSLTDDAGKVIRTVTAADGLAKVLGGGEKRPIRFESPAADTVELPEGSYPDREVEFDLPNAGITGGCELGTVKLTGVGEAGCALSGHIGTLLAGGGEMQISLSGGADKVYITGADTVLTLEAGEYPVLYCDNVSSEIVNKTDAAVTLILPNGTGVEIPRGKRYIMETGKLKTAW